ncbi:hypothetical protein ACER0C_016129 [Sarotherodon galilaeus]
MLHQSGVFVSLLLVLLHINPSLPYALKNCSVQFSVNVRDVSVTCSDRDLAAVPDDIPRNASTLDLTNNHIQMINRRDLGGLSKLVYLQIVLNSLSHIDDGAFADMGELRELDVSRNSLRNLTANIFQGLSKLNLVSLQKVGLNSNNLHQMSEIVPILLLPNLYELDAGMNMFSSFDSDSLHVNKSNLRRLFFNGNPLKEFSIRRDIFPDLQYMDLTKCSDGFEWKVPNKTFLRSLTGLLLSGTEIRFETYRTILQSAESVTYLWLSYVKEWFDKGLTDIACQIPALTNLDLTFNDILVLNDTLLQMCSNITELALASNQMTGLSQISLRGLNQLEQLRIGFNFLASVPPAIRGLSTLPVLLLTSNDIGELGCSDFLKLTRLMQLFLSNNRISKLRGCVFRDLNNLRLLDIEGNPIFSLSDTFTGGLQNLRILLMRGNDLKQLEKGYFESVPMLLSLDLVSLSSYYVENGTFEELHRLESLIITAFTLTKDMFRGLRNLKSLTIYFPASLNNMTNQLFDGPAFLNLPSLRELTIKHNNRYTMVISPDVLRGLRYLQSLETEKFFTTTPHPDTFTFTPLLTSLKLISSNVSLPTPELFGPIPNLQALDLSKNKLCWLKLRENELTVINETVFQYLPALRYLDLFGNPFTCDCSNIGFIQWVKHNNQVQVLLDFDIQSCWMDISFICFISSTCIIVLTLLTSFIYHFLMWQLVYALHLFLAFLYDNRKRKKGILCQYDAFVSYNVRDEEWVCREMLPVLEGEQGWRLCLHHRDFQPGKPIIENITDAIYSSRKTICVISRSYLQSEWCSREIQMARWGRSWQLSPYYRMRKLVKKRTYLSWPRAGQHPGVF